MYFETDSKVFKMYFQYLNTIFLYFNPTWEKNLNFRPCLKYILDVVKLYFIKSVIKNLVRMGYVKLQTSFQVQMITE